MSASRKILARKRHFRNNAIRLKYGPFAEIVRLRANCSSLEKENTVIKDERERLQVQLNLWRSESLDPKVLEENHWRRRYALRNLEAERLEGRLGISEAEIVRLKVELDQKDTLIKQLRKDLWAASSEKAPLEPPKTEPANENKTTESANVGNPAKSQKRPRGKQPGAQGHGPRHHSNLPVDEEFDYDLEESCCSECGEQWRYVSTSESDEVEVSVRAYRRRYRRKKYGHFCKKKQKWVSKTAAGANRLFPHSSYGISCWVFLLVGRFVLHIAVNRLRMLLAEKELHVSQGTITAGFARIHPLIKPLARECRRYSRENKHHWHIDDTGWKVFVLVDGKTGYGWYLWVFRSDDVCVYILSQSRARAVPQSHLQHSSGIVTSDRLAANKKLGEHLVHSFCWVHERREFRELARTYPELFKTCNHFLELIGSLFHFNKQRLLAAPGGTEYADFESKLRDALERILADCHKHLADQNLHTELRRVLKGIVKDWDGLYLFLEMPHVPPDNNAAERALRGQVCSRKSSYGSGAKWSADFLADMYTLTETLQLNGVSAEKFLSEYLKACADNGGKPPADAHSFLPWNQRPP